MGYIEDRKAEGERQAFEAAKKAEAVRILNQGTPGLAQIAADPYVSGISQEDIYKLALAKQAQEANAKAAYDKLAADRFNASKAGIDQVNAAKQYNIELGGWDGPFKDETNPVYKQFNVDPGLAAKWMADREAFK